MSAKVRNVVPKELFASLEPATPASILARQSSAFEELSSGLIKGEVKTYEMTGSGDRGRAECRHELYLTAPRIKLSIGVLAIEHEAKLVYPCTVYRFSEPTDDRKSIVRGWHEWVGDGTDEDFVIVSAASADDLYAILQQAFGGRTVRAVIQSLLAQSAEAQGA